MWISIYSIYFTFVFYSATIAITYMAYKLTIKQQRVLDYLSTYIREHGQSPTIAEIQDFMHLKAVRSVSQFIEILEQKGYIKRDGFKHRGITVLNNELQSFEQKFIHIPLIASVGCDEGLVLADEKKGEFISIYKSLISTAQDVYAFKAVGNSMIDAGVKNGDYVLVKKTPQVESNDKVVAIIDGVAVLKRLYKSGDTIVLHPEAAGYSPIILDKDFQIFGKLISVVPSGMSPDENTDDVDEITFEPVLN